MSKTLLSVVIPIYNSQATIGQVLEAIFQSTPKVNLEVILIDDGSKNISKIKKIKSKFPKNKLKLYRQKHLGPAIARNLGAKKARGKIIVFLDSDVIPESDCLSRIVNDFKKDNKLSALNGVYSKRPANPSFFTWYFSLFKYHQWVCSNIKDYTGFSTKLAAIKKDVFLNLGGLDGQYRDALVEDYEFGYRLRNQKYKVLVDNQVCGAHFHPNFKQCFNNYYQRVYLWLKLFGQRKQFDNATTTKSVGLANGFGFLSLVTLPLALFYQTSILFILPFIIAFTSFFILYAGFHMFVLKEKGLLWTIAAIITSLLLSIPLGLAFIKFILLDKLGFGSQSRQLSI
jgi:glycosyltransferase involved in cell wall biosynthesis